jgi:hypothetical protein
MPLCGRVPFSLRYTDVINCSGLPCDSCRVMWNQAHRAYLHLTEKWLTSRLASTPKTSRAISSPLRAVITGTFFGYLRAGTLPPHGVGQPICMPPTGQQWAPVAKRFLSLAVYFRVFPFRTAPFIVMNLKLSVPALRWPCSAPRGMKTKEPGFAMYSLPDTWTAIVPVRM